MRDNINEHKKEARELRTKTLREFPLVIRKCSFSSVTDYDIHNCYTNTKFHLMKIKDQIVATQFSPLQLKTRALCSFSPYSCAS